MIKGKHRSLFLLVSGLSIALTLASCAPPAQPPAPAPTAPAPTAAPAPPAPTAAPIRTPAPAPAAPTATPPASVQIKRGGTLRLITPTTFPHWDPHRSAGDVDMWEYLGNYIVNYDPKDGSAVPELAEKWEFKDARTLLLTIRKGVKFHNLPPVPGREITADDIVWNLKRITRPGPLYIWKSNFEPVESFTAPDKYTVQIRMKTPFAPILSYLKGGILPNQPMLAPEVEEKLGGEEAYKDLSNARSTGPFMIKSYVPSVSGEAVRNPDYWQSGKPYIDRVQMLIVPDLATMIAAYRTGAVDYGISSNASVDITTKKDIERTNPTIRFNSIPEPWIVTLVPNLKRKPFEDVRVRKAMFLAIDRQEMLQVNTGGGGHISGPMSWKLFPGWTWSEQDLMKKEGYRPKNTPEGQADIAEAQKLMKDAGYGPDKPLVLEAEGAQFAQWSNLTPMEIAKSELDKIYIRIPTIKIVDRAQWFDTEARGDFSFRSRTYNAPMEPDAQLYLRHHSAGGRNYQKLSDPQVDKLLQEQRQELDAAKRRQLVLQAQERLFSLYPLIWLHTREPYLMQQPWVVMQPTAWRRAGDPASIWLNR